MFDLSKITGFEWDKGNIAKSFQKHGITPSETEEIFLADNLKVTRDIEHSQKEKRFVALGKTFENKVVFVVFAIRGENIRVISARIANKKERGQYEKEIKKDTKI